MAQALGEFLDRYMNHYLVVFIISMLPILELRGGLIVASLLGLNWWLSAIVCMAGNMILVPFIVRYAVRVLAIWSDHAPWHWLQRYSAWLTRKGHRAAKRLKTKYPRKFWLGLMIFVAIPLPGTGAWTGAIVSALMGLRPRYATLPICIGVVIACGAMLLLAYTLPSAFGL